MQIVILTLCSQLAFAPGIQVQEQLGENAKQAKPTVMMTGKSKRFQIVGQLGVPFGTMVTVRGYIKQVRVRRHSVSPNSPWSRWMAIHGQIPASRAVWKFPSNRLFG